MTAGGSGPPNLEAKVGPFDGVNFFGADAELWLARNQPLDVSVHGGFHVGASDFTDRPASISASSPARR